MSEKIIKNNVYLIILIVIVLLLLVYIKFYDDLCLECIFNKKEYMQNGEKNNNHECESTTYQDIQNANPVIQGNNAFEIINDRASQKINRVYGQNDFPYKEPGFYDKTNYPNLALPFQVISSGGWRNLPTLGGTQAIIANSTVPLDISDDNISPRNIVSIRTQPDVKMIGSVYKIYGSANSILPLYQVPNRNNYYNYFTINDRGVQIPVITKNRTDSLGDSDTVFLKNIKEPYRVSIYSDDSPVYLPFV